MVRTKQEEELDEEDAKEEEGHKAMKHRGESVVDYKIKRRAR